MKVSWQFPLTTVSESNSSEHWSKKARRHRKQQGIIELIWHTHDDGIELPCTITLTRLAERQLDYDNWVAGAKYIKDAIAGLLCPEKIVSYKNKNGRTVRNKGHCDDDDRITWKYAQEKAKIMQLRIDFEFEAPEIENPPRYKPSEFFRS